MSVTGTLAAFALRYTFNESADALVGAVERHFTDRSQALPHALTRANDRAWLVLGMALSGDGLFDRAKGLFHGRDVTALRDQFRQFLALTATGLEQSPDEMRARACEELNRVRKSGRLSGALDRDRITTDMRRYGAATELVASAERAVGEVADALATDAPNLTTVLRITPPGGIPLLASAFVYFFRREVENNEQLSRTLTFDSLRSLTASHERGFALLDDRTSGILDQIDAMFDEFVGLNTKLDAGFAGVDTANAKLDQIAQRLLKPGISYATDDERAYLLQRKEEYRRNAGRVSAAEWARLGDTMNSAQMYPEAREAHEAAATTAKAVGDTAGEASNHYKAYLDACDSGSWEVAAERLWKAVELDEAAYQPFPLYFPNHPALDRGRYQPLRILGGGAFGTVFLCRDHNNPDPETGELLAVAIKTLRSEALSRDLLHVLGEAITLKALQHPNIIGILDQGFADRARTRPYLILEYFPGQTLDRLGTLPLPDFFSIARQVAEAVHAAHSRPRPIYHRDIKPSNIMVLRNGDGTWTVKVIDFGLAVRGSVARVSQSVPPAKRSTKDKSVTGTLKYAPPEQTGDLPGVEVGPYSDVYSFGKTCLNVLFGSTSPKSWDWEELPTNVREPLHRLLERCTADALKHRHPNFEPVLKALAELDPAEIAKRDREQAERKRRAEEVERARVEAERREVERLEAERRQQEEERTRREREEAQRQKRADEAREEAERKRQAEQAERLRVAAEAAERRRKADEAERARVAAAEATRVAAQQRAREEAAWQEAERLKRDLEEAERKRKEEEAERALEAAIDAERERQAEEVNLARVAAPELADAVSAIRLGQTSRQDDERREAELRKKENEQTQCDEEEAAQKRRDRVEAKIREGLDPARARTPGEKLKFTIPGGVEMRFAWCPPGSFRMGSDHPNGDFDEKPVHKVILSRGFFIGIHPVTQAQWKALMGTDPSHFKGPNRPVESVSWDDCQQFCSKLTALLKNRVTVRLPTEAEWEYACRAGAATEYHFSDVLNTDLANYNGNYAWNNSLNGEYREQTTDVGSFPTNSWALSDVHGNVWEWCSDWFGPYVANDQTNPQGEPDGDSRVMRGGSWGSDPVYCRAAGRSRRPPGFRNYNCGVRVCFSFDPPSFGHRACAANEHRTAPPNEEAGQWHTTEEFHSALVQNHENVAAGRGYAVFIGKQKPAHCEVIGGHTERFGKGAKRLACHPDEIPDWQAGQFYTERYSSTEGLHVGQFTTEDYDSFDELRNAVVLLQRSESLHTEAPEYRHVLSWLLPVETIAEQNQLLDRLHAEGALPAPPTYPGAGWYDSNKDIPITCAGCYSTFEVPKTLAGKSIRCTACKVQMIVHEFKERSRDADHASADVCVWEEALEALLNEDFRRWDASWAVFREVPGPEEARKLLNKLVGSEQSEGWLTKAPTEVRARLRAACADVALLPPRALLVPIGVGELEPLLAGPPDWAGYTAFVLMANDAMNWLPHIPPSNRTQMRRRAREFLFGAPPVALAAYVHSARPYLDTDSDFLDVLFKPFSPSAAKLMDALLAANTLEPGDWIKLCTSVGLTQDEWGAYLLENDRLGSLLVGLGGDGVGQDVWEAYLVLLTPALVSPDLIEADPDTNPQAVHEWERKVHAHLRTAAERLKASGMKLAPALPEGGVKRLFAANNLLKWVENPAQAERDGTAEVQHACATFDVDRLEVVRVAYFKGGFDQLNLPAQLPHLEPLLALFLTAFPMDGQYHTARMAVTQWLNLSSSCPPEMRGHFQAHFVLASVSDVHYANLLADQRQYPLDPLAEATIRLRLASPTRKAGAKYVPPAPTPVGDDDAGGGGDGELGEPHEIIRTKGRKREAKSTTSPRTRREDGSTSAPIQTPDEDVAEARPVGENKPGETLAGCGCGIVIFGIILYCLVDGCQRWIALRSP